MEGVISAATQRYREGLKFLDETTREELSHVYQTPAPAVNNGVLLTLDGKSIWTVTGTSYLTRLELKAGAEVRPRRKVRCHDGEWQGCTTGGRRLWRRYHAGDTVKESRACHLACLLLDCGG